METSEIPPLKATLPANSLAVAPEFRLFLHVAINDVGALGPQFSKEHERLCSIDERLEKGTFQLAVFGPSGSGKSTLINALLGEPLLPTSMDWLTGIPVVLRYGSKPLFRISFYEEALLEDSSDKSALEFFTLLPKLILKSDDATDGHEIRSLEILYPAAILEQGVVLIRVPAIMTKTMGNWTVTIDTLMQCDAILFVKSSHTPLNETDADLIKEMRLRDVPVLFILNQVDGSGAIGKETALESLTKIIEAEFTSSELAPIFSVCLRRGLDAKLFGELALWKESGLQEVESYLNGLAQAKNAVALRESVSGEVIDIIQGVLTQVRLSIQSFQSPFRWLQSRLHVLEEELKDIQRQRSLEKAALNKDLKNTLRMLEDEADTLRQRSRDYLREVAAKELADTEHPESIEQTVQDALAGAIGTHFGHALKEMSRSFDHRVSEILSSHQKHAEELVEHVFRTTAELFSFSYLGPVRYAAFEMKRRPYWVLRKWVPAFPRLVPENWIDKLMPTTVRKKRLTHRLLAQIDALVAHNVENLRWAIYQNLQDTFHLFGSQLDERFLEATIATRGTIEAACLMRHDYHRQKVADHVARLRSAEAGLNNLCEEINAWLTDSESAAAPVAGSE